ncbi:hypothetical protein [Jannaschia ovalis]|uniref:GspL cytoplasmic actin-ATPase-like domain-containing protein n=1 Tax=Jannaschia ovalis TaxID=3038773 RepID=A0ABY8LBZ2_9RHOB|nr:hypothetical protein [Jannaschia sp. GRR-S6-38]WGH78848.1 hypothetical protein P8627_00895 [Jannaschia sp. GRR-S6-38]
MTALEGIDRFETVALWRETAGAQRREVYIAIGEAELVVQDRAGAALSHWSLPALERLNPGEMPARYVPAPGAGEELEIAEPEMVAALERLAAAVAMGRRRPGALRRVLIGLGLGFAAGLVAIWLPGAMRDQAARMMPAPQRAEIGQRLLTELTALTGPPCDAILGAEALDILEARLVPGADMRLAVLRDLPQPALALPGDLFVLSDSVLVTQDEPAVAAGHLLATALTARLEPPLRDLLAGLGPFDLMRLLASGEVTEEAIAGHVEGLLLSDPALADAALLRDGFAAARLDWAPFARDAGLPAGAPGAADLPPVLDDTTWLSLQGICDG